MMVGAQTVGALSKQTISFQFVKLTFFHYSVIGAGCSIKQQVDHPGVTMANY